MEFSLPVANCLVKHSSPLILDPEHYSARNTRVREGDQIHISYVQQQGCFVYFVKACSQPQTGVSKEILFQAAHVHKAPDCRLFWGQKLS